MGVPPSPYPPLYTPYFDVLKGGSMPRLKFFRKKSEKMDFWGKTEKKIFQKFSGIWDTPSRWSVVSGSIYNKQYTMEELIGVIKLFAGEHFVPQGYMECNGQILPLQTYVALFSIIGVAYGGNGQTNFALPKLTPPDEKMKYIICVEGVYPPRP